MTSNMFEFQVDFSSFFQAEQERVMTGNLGREEEIIKGEKKME